MVKRKTIREIACGYSGRERYCHKCGLKNGMICPYLEICDRAYIRGFLRGRKYARQERKEEKV